MKTNILRIFTLGSILLCSTAFFGENTTNRCCCTCSHSKQESIQKQVLDGMWNTLTDERSYAKDYDSRSTFFKNFLYYNRYPCALSIICSYSLAQKWSPTRFDKWISKNGKRPLLATDQEAYTFGQALGKKLAKDEIDRSIFTY
jgi:hypothetical protein